MKSARTRNATTTTTTLFSIQILNVQEAAIRLETVQNDLQHNRREFYVRSGPLIKHATFKRLILFGITITSNGAIRLTRRKKNRRSNYDVLRFIKTKTRVVLKSYFKKMVFFFLIVYFGGIGRHDPSRLDVVHINGDPPREGEMMGVIR